MTTNYHTAISTGAAANAATFNTPLGTLDAAIGTLNTTVTTIDGTVDNATTGIYNVLDYGAVGDGATDDATAIQAAITAAGADGIVYFPSGTYACGSSIEVATDCTLLGYGAIMLFGATDGLEISHAYAQNVINGLELRTNSATGGKALYISNADYSAHVCLRDIRITVVDYTADRWTHGVWATNWESTSIYNLYIYAAATVGVHLENNANALHFFGSEITGGVGTAGPTPVEHFIEIDGSGTVSFHGGSWQGYAAHSGLRVTGSSVQVHGVGLENTCATPSDGDDIYLATTVDSLFSGCAETQGLYAENTSRNITCIGCGFGGAYTLAAGSLGHTLIGCRVDSLAIPAGSQHTILGCVNSTGARLPDELTASSEAALLLNSKRYLWGEWVYDNVRVSASDPASDDDAGAALASITGYGAPVTNKATVIERGAGPYHTTVLTFTLTGDHDVDLADGADHGTSVKVYDFPSGYIHILGAVVNASVTVNDAFNASPNDVFFLACGTVAAGDDNDLTGTEADIIPKTTLDTVGNTTLTLDWHAAMAAGALFPKGGGALDLHVNAAVDDDSTTKAVTLAITGTITLTWIDLGDY